MSMTFTTDQQRVIDIRDCNVLVPVRQLCLLSVL